MHPSYVLQTSPAYITTHTICNPSSLPRFFLYKARARTIPPNAAKPPETIFPTAALAEVTDGIEEVVVLDTEEEVLIGVTVVKVALELGVAMTLVVLVMLEFEREVEEAV